MRTALKSASCLLAAALCLTAPALAGAEKPLVPLKGFHPAGPDDAAGAALLVQRVLQGLNTADPHLIAGVLDPGYQEAAPATLAHSGFVRSTSRRKMALRRIVHGRSGFVKSFGAADDNRRAAQLNVSLNPAASHGYAVRVLARGDAGELLGSVTLDIEKGEDGWRVMRSDGLSLLAGFDAAAPDSPELPAITARQFGETFLQVPLADEQNIGILSKSVAEEKLDRALFGIPHGSALFADIRELQSAPFVQSTYVQVISDLSWNRLLYGDYARSLKAWDGSSAGTSLKRPHGIAADARGVIFVADTGNRRVVVLKVTGDQNDRSLLYIGEIGAGALQRPTELAWDDRGTLEDHSDDLIWIVDPGAGELSAWRATPSVREPVVTFASRENLEPTAVAVGRFDGRSDGNIYMADRASRKIYRMFYDGNTLGLVDSVASEKEIMVTSLATDHWGHLYATDRANNAVRKFSPQLDLLAAQNAVSGDARPLRFQTLFARVQRLGEPPALTGFDQAFVLEDWQQSSGGRRFQLGMAAALEAPEISDDLAALVLRGRLTDPAELRVRLTPASGSGNPAEFGNWHLAGDVKSHWDRRLQDGTMVAPGRYSVSVTATSTYGQSHELRQEQMIYIPAYYAVDCGAATRSDPYLRQGSATTMGAHRIVTHESAVVYSFPDLNPGLDYEVQATYVSGEDGVTQALFTGDRELHPAVTVGSRVVETDWIRVEGDVVENGSLELRVVKQSGSAPASLAGIRLRQADFDADNPPAEPVATDLLPDRFSLDQNYPNPFNPSTTISFEIPAGFSGPVTLRIYNMMGQEIRQLIDSDLAPGRYQRIWNGRDDDGRRAASGLYLYRLTAGTFVQTRKLVMMK